MRERGGRGAKLITHTPSRSFDARAAPHEFNDYGSVESSTLSYTATQESPSRCNSRFPDAVSLDANFRACLGIDSPSLAPHIRSSMLRCLGLVFVIWHRINTKSPSLTPLPKSVHGFVAVSMYTSLQTTPLDEGFRTGVFPTQSPESPRRTYEPGRKIICSLIRQ